MLLLKQAICRVLISAAWWFLTLFSLWLLVQWSVAYKQPVGFFLANPLEGPSGTPRILTSLDKKPAVWTRKDTKQSFGDGSEFVVWGFLGVHSIRIGRGIPCTFPLSDGLRKLSCANPHGEEEGKACCLSVSSHPWHDCSKLTQSC